MKQNRSFPLTVKVYLLIVKFHVKPVLFWTQTRAPKHSSSLDFKNKTKIQAQIFNSIEHLYTT